MESSRFVASKAIKPFVIPQKVPNTPRVETKVGKYSTMRRLATSLSLPLNLKTQMKQIIKAITIMPKQNQVSVGTLISMSFMVKYFFDQKLKNKTIYKYII